MRAYRQYGRVDGDVDLPKWESFRFRAMRIYHELRLCEWCLRSNRRCIESLRFNRRDRSWKRHRRQQYQERGEHARDRTE